MHTARTNVRANKTYELKSFFRLFGVKFELSTNGNSSTGRDCDTAVELDAVVSRDYLVITERQIVSADGDVVVVETKYCGNSLLGREIVGKSTRTFVYPNNKICFVVALD